MCVTVYLTVLTFNKIVKLTKSIMHKNGYWLNNRQVAREQTVFFGQPENNDVFIYL